MAEYMTIKEMYDCEPEENPIYSLQIWYNEVIQKNELEVSIPDVLRMIRQKMFLETAVKKAVEFLADDPFAYEGYEGQLLEHLSRVDQGYLADYGEQLRSIAQNAIDRINEPDWVSEEYKNEYLDALKILCEKLPNA